MAQALLAEIDHLPWRFHVLEQRPSRDVDAGVGCLGREDDRNQQLVGIAGFEFGGRGRVGLGKTAEELENLLALHRLPITSRIE